MTQPEFRAAFRESPVQRAKRRGLDRNAAVVLGNVGTTGDVDVLTRALADPEPLPSLHSGQAVREHAAWALARISADTEAGAATPRPAGEPR